MADCPDRRAKSRQGAVRVVRWASKVGNTARSTAHESANRATRSHSRQRPGHAGAEHYLATCGLEKKLLDLIRFRVSEMNGCAYCLDMHWKDLRAEGETEQRLYSLDAWRDALLQRARARRAGVGRSRHPGCGHARPGRCVRAGAAALRCATARRSDPRNGRDQRLEPAEHRVPDHPGDLSSAEVSRRCGGLMRG